MNVISTMIIARHLQISSTGGYHSNFSAVQDCVGMYFSVGVNSGPILLNHPVIWQRPILLEEFLEIAPPIILWYINNHREEGRVLLLANDTPFF